jgi:hypothetical protein
MFSEMSICNLQFYMEIFRNNITRLPIFSENFDFMTKSLLLGNSHETRRLKQQTLSLIKSKFSEKKWKVELYLDRQIPE